MTNYRLQRAQFQLMVTMFIFVFPISLVIFAFSSCDLRRRGDKHACRDGAAERCLAVGQFYESRTDGIIGFLLSNAKTAKEAYQRGCKLGNLPSCARFGHMEVVGSYDQARDEDATRDDGLAALTTACNGGITDSCRELAGAVDPAQAVPILDKLCKAGDKPSCAKQVSAIAANDPKAALELAAKQCEAGDDTQCGEVADAFFGGSGDEPARGVALLTKACDRGAWSLCNHLGEAYVDGRLEADGERAGEFFGKGCEHDDADSCFDAAKLVVATESAKSVKLFTSNCEKGDLRGCDALGDMWRVGTDATPRSRAKALSMYDRSCRSGNDFDCYKRDCMNSPDNASDACMKVHRMQKEYVYRLGAHFEMR